MKLMCWITHSNGMVLIDDSGTARGILIELPIQRVGQSPKRLQKPSEWFKMDALEAMKKKGA
ncbi:hypothetical protein SAMN05518848_104202 [Paenibacillus sp. PDC88]|nr:hypothetical protein SAMN05518848_104202 [Paenibacillus sp. PDC88]